MKNTMGLPLFNMTFSFGGIKLGHVYKAQTCVIPERKLKAP
jgi:hypothetical protein